MTNIGVPLLEEQVSDLRKRLQENKKIIEGFSSFIRSAALTNPLQLDSVIRTITTERDKAETEVLILERELATKENQLCELKSENQGTGMRDRLKELLEKFDTQGELKKRDIIHLIIPKIIVQKDNKLEIWVRRDLGSKPAKFLTNVSFESDFGYGSASYQPTAGVEKKGFSNFLGKHGFEGAKVQNDCVAVSGSPCGGVSSGLSHLEESGSSECELAGLTGLEPAASRVTGERYNHLTTTPSKNS